MPGQGNRTLLALSWIWVAIVCGYMLWGMANETGLYGWVADWQLRRWGSYDTKLTLFLPGLVLVAPAGWYLGRHARHRRALDAADPQAAHARQRRQAKWAALAGLVALAVAGAVYAMSQNVPDGSEPPVPFDVATLGSGPVPEQRVQIRGAIEPEATTGVTEESLGQERSTFYVGFRPDGDTDKDAPLRLFIERRTGTGPPTAQAFLPEQDGYLTRNGLPGIALRDLQSRGIRVADPHYVLGGGDSGRRGNYYLVAFLAGFVGFVLLLAAVVTWFRKPKTA